VFILLFSICLLDVAALNKERKNLKSSQLCSFAAFVNSDCEVGDKDVQKPVENLHAFRTLCLF